MSNNAYDVYLGIYAGLPRDHHAIWIDTGNTKQLPDGRAVAAGVLVQVKGNIQSGMTFDVKNAVDPTISLEGKGKRKIGTIKKNDLQRLIQICQNLSPPPKQFNGPKRINPNKPLYRCQDWTAEAIQLLIDDGVLRPEVP